MLFLKKIDTKREKDWNGLFFHKKLYLLCNS